MRHVRRPIARLIACGSLFLLTCQATSLAQAATVIPAANTSARSGGWQTAGTELYAWNGNQWVEYRVDFGTAGNWTLAVTAKNQVSPSAPGLPSGYAFQLTVALDGNSKGTLQVPGSTTTYQTGTLTFSAPGGVHTLRLTWTNDAYKAGVYDANLRLKELSLALPIQQVATPTITPAGGTFVDSVQVTLTTVTTGAEIHYTVDGTIPTTNSLLYISALTLTSSTTVKAKAFKAGMSDSAVASVVFAITTQPKASIIPAANTSARSGSWIVEGTDVYYWNSGVWLEYRVDFGLGGTWTFGATATNQNSSSAPGLPTGYTFNLTVAIDGASKGTLQVPGSTTMSQTGTLQLAMTAGVHTVRLTWTNDAYSAGLYDANIRVRQVSFAPQGVDATPPNIGSIGVTNITDVSAIITWTTNELATSEVDYGLVADYGQTKQDGAPVTNHQIVLTRLTAGTTHHFRVRSVDVAGNLSQSGDRTFETFSGPYDIFVVPSVTKVLPQLSLPTNATRGPAMLSLARNESEAIQLVLRTGLVFPLQQVTVIITDLQQTNGTGVIPTQAITWSAVGSVKTQQPVYAVSYVGWWPDYLPAAAPFDVPQGWLQSVWITVRADATLPPGDYTGTVTIRPTNAPEQQIPLRVTVRNFTLPATPVLPSAFDLYINRIQTGYATFFPNWWATWQSNQEELLQRFYNSLIDHRLAPILNVDVNSPERVNYLAQASAPASLVLPAPGLQGMLDRGLSAFGIGAYSGSFGNNWPTTTTDLDALKPTYAQYATVMRSHTGWLDRHYIYTYDEPSPGLAYANQVAQMLHDADPEIKNLITLGNSFNVDTLAAWFAPFDRVVIRNVIFSQTQADKLRQLGKDVWIYVSSPEPPYPTLVIDYPAMAPRILPWMCWKYKINGLLYWCVNYWKTNPYQDPNNTQWGQNGNGSLFYPGPDGPVASIRLELLRDGMEDYDYLALLNQQVARVKASPSAMADPQVQTLVTQAEQALAVDSTIVQSLSAYTQDAQVLLNSRTTIANLIEQLQAVAAP